MPRRVLADRLHARRPADPPPSPGPAGRPRAAPPPAPGRRSPRARRGSPGRAPARRPRRSRRRRNRGRSARRSARPHAAAAQRRPPADARASAAAAGGRPGRPPDPPSAPRPPAGRGAGGDQRGQLRRGLDVAREQDDAARRIGAEQRGLVGRQRRPGDPDDGGLQKSATEQPAPLARTRSQNAVACAVSAKPPVRTRHNAWPSCSVLLNAGCADRAGRACASTAAATPTFAASSECTAASCTSAPFAAGAAPVLLRRDAGFAATGLAVRPSQPPLAREPARAAIGAGERDGGEVGGARSACGAGASGGGASLPPSLRCRPTGCPRSRRPPACRRDSPASPESAGCRPAPRERRHCDGRSATSHQPPPAARRPGRRRSAPVAWWPGPSPDDAEECDRSGREY